jgi:hypothetical protein
MFSGNFIETIRNALHRKEIGQINPLDCDGLIRSIIVQPGFMDQYENLVKGLEETKILRIASESESWNLIKEFIQGRLNTIIALLISENPEAQALLGLAARMEKTIYDREALVTVYTEIHRIRDEIANKQVEVTHG